LLVIILSQALLCICACCGLFQLEELPIAQEKIIGLHQKKENLEAIISMKTDHEK